MTCCYRVSVIRRQGCISKGEIAVEHISGGETYRIRRTAVEHPHPRQLHTIDHSASLPPTLRIFR